MSILLQNGLVFTKAGFIRSDVLIERGHISQLSDINREEIPSDIRCIDCSSFLLIPGLVDVHVHLRVPGFFYKESMLTGTKAAAKGGYTCVCPMPNVKPAPSSYENLALQLDLIKKEALIKVKPYGTITKNQDGKSSLSDMEDLAAHVVGFSDDGVGIQTGDLMESAMEKAKSLNSIIVAHCEDEILVQQGYIHDGIYAALHHHRGISSKSEWIQVQRDIELCEKTGCAYHICHVSTKESVALIREAKRRGVNVTAETAPHYLILCDQDLQEEGRFKMNPPLRDASDRQALLEGIQDGTIDIIATDHAPHSQEEKAQGLQGSKFGIVGLETAFSLMVTELVRKGWITMEKLIDLMCIQPRKRFGLEGPLYIEEGELADLCVVDLEHTKIIDSSAFESKGKATPFEGYEVVEGPVLTICDGEIVYEKEGRND